MFIKKSLKEIDKIALEKYDVAQKSFLGRIGVKLASEIVLACLIAFAIYVGTTIYDELSLTSSENKKLNQIYISVSEEYVQEQFDTPYIRFDDDENLTNSFYLLEDIILRTVSKDGRVIAYFVTITNEKRRLPVDSFDVEKNILGKLTFFEVGFANPAREANVNGNGRYCYYFEIQGTGRYGMYNYYLYGSAPYGFVSDDVASLRNRVAFDSENEAEIETLRQSARPNTFGVIADGYENQIGILPASDEWENMHHLLVRE